EKVVPGIELALFHSQLVGWRLVGLLAGGKRHRGDECKGQAQPCDWHPVFWFAAVEPLGNCWCEARDQQTQHQANGHSGVAHLCGELLWECGHVRAVWRCVEQTHQNQCGQVNQRNIAGSNRAEEYEDHSACTQGTGDEDWLAADDIGKQCQERLGYYRRHISHGDDRQHGGALDVIVYGVRQTEDIQDGVHHRVGRRTHDAQNRAPVVFEEFYNWRLRSLGDFFYLLFKGLRFCQVLTNPQCCNGHQRTEQEWNAPAPGI